MGGDLHLHIFHPDPPRSSYSVASTYSSSGFGYAIDYTHTLYSFFSKPKPSMFTDNIRVGLRVADVKPSDSYIVLYPYIYTDYLSRWLKLRIAKTYVRPYIDVGYYINTNFKDTNHSIGFGGGIRCLAGSIRQVNISITSGYSALVNNTNNSYFYLGVRLEQRITIF